MHYIQHVKIANEHGAPSRCCHQQLDTFNCILLGFLGSNEYMAHSHLFLPANNLVRKLKQKNCFNSLKGIFLIRYIRKPEKGTNGSPNVQ